jgi:aspartate kinase
MLLEDPKDIRGGANKRVRHRPIVVQKYGGSSVADVDKLGYVADRIVATRRAGHDVVAVVSAMGKSTDGLLELARQVAASGTDGEGVSEPPRRELDMLVSTGERVSMSLLSIAIAARGEDAISFTGSQCGIITNDQHFNARIIEVRPHRIEDELARGRIVIVAGYQGMSYRREITTLGRGGTDTTAVALAAALEAERCEIYSDVDGVYSADPRAVPDAAHLPEIDYAMLQEMATAGAKVLCAQAVEWARRSGVAIFARSTFDPIDAPKRQTLVRKFGPSDEPRARAVTCHKAIALVDVGERSKVSAVVDHLAETGAPVAELCATGRGAAIVVALTNAPDWAATRSGLRAMADVALREDVALVSVVGDGMTERADSRRRFRAVLDAEGCAPAHLSLSSPLRMSAVIDADRALEVQQGLHAAFVAER